MLQNDEKKKYIFLITMNLDLKEGFSLYLLQKLFFYLTFGV